MKKLFVLFAALAFVACNNEEAYEISVNIPELGGEQLNLQKRTSGEFVTIDSVLLDSSGYGVLEGSVDSEEMMYLYVKNSRNNLPIFMGNYAYTINGTMEDYKIEADGGPQIDFNEYQDYISPFDEKQQKILDSYYKARAEQTSEDSLQDIIDMFYMARDEKIVADSVYMTEHPASVISVYLLRSSFHSYDIPSLEAALSAFDSTLKSSKYYTFLAEHLESMKKVEIGQKYLDIELPDTLGNPVKLSDFSGNGPLLVDFWAAWCGPCRRANPGVVKLYNKYHDQGFDIVGISLDNTKEDWLKAINDDGLIWHHMSDIKGWNSAAADLYAVVSIPHTVLLNKDGIIVAKNLSEEELEEKVKELLEN